MNNKYNCPYRTAYLDGVMILNKEYVKKPNDNPLCENGHKLIFTSRNNKKCFVHDNKEMEWHLNWKSRIKNVGGAVECKNELDGKYCRTDAKLNKYQLEFQHSYINTEKVDERTNHNKQFGNVIWIIDASGDSFDELFDGRILIHIKKAWKYDSFKNLHRVYFDDSAGNLYKVVPNNIIKSSGMLYVKYKIKIDDFISSLESEEEEENKLNDNNEDKQCKIYLNQKGAGNGKTFGAIQLLDLDKFKEKNTFIYLTKFHTAVYAIYSEFTKQSAKFQLKGQTNEINEGKQYEIIYTNNGEEKRIVIGTIDSFFYRLNRDPKPNVPDFFKGIIEKLIETPSTTTSVNYKKQYHLRKKTLIIIDEAQDLSKWYIQAIAKIQGNTGFDIYIIGDILQSIWVEENTFTYLKEMKSFPCAEIVEEESENVVRRFHDKKLKNFVNNLVPFDKYKVPEIKGICENKKCGIKHNGGRIEIFKMGYPEDDDYEKLLTYMLNLMKEDVEKHNLKPGDILFVSPVIRKNPFLRMLELKIQHFWMEKYNETDDKKMYCHIHTSEEGKPIDLKESVGKTRIMSFHACKGSTYKIVFVLQLSEKNIKKYTNEILGLKYESLLYVPITRSELSLYIGLSGDNNCEIYNRIEEQWIINGGLGCKINNICEIKDKSKLMLMHPLNKITNDYDKIFSKLNESFGLSSYKKDEYCDIKNNREQMNVIIDWGHHTTRNAMANCTLLELLCPEDAERFQIIIKKLCNKKITKLPEVEYNKEIRNINSIMDNGKFYESKIIPILVLTSRNDKYKEYSEWMSKIGERIQKVLKKNDCKYVYHLCPPENLILYHFIDITTLGRYSETACITIYNIMSYYEDSFDPKDEHKYECLCKDLFKKGHSEVDSICLIIKNHYKIIDHLKEQRDIYNNELEIKYGGNDSNKFEYSCYVKTQIEYEGFMTLYNRHYILAHSNEYVINVIFRPQVSELNLYEILIKLIFDDYSIKNCNKYCKDKNDKDKYKNKRVIHCIFTLSEKRPRFYEFEQTDPTKNCMKDIIKDYVSIYFKNNMLSMYNILNSLKREFKKSNAIKERYKAIYGELPKFMSNILTNNWKSLDKLFESKDTFKIEYEKEMNRELEESFE